MNGVLIDDKRIKVDFSQSVSKYWINFKKILSLIIILKLILIKEMILL